MLISSDTICDVERHINKEYLRYNTQNRHYVSLSYIWSLQMDDSSTQCEF